MGLERIISANLEKIGNVEQISLAVKEALESSCYKFIDCKPNGWKNAVEKVMKNGNKILTNPSGGKAVVRSGENLVYRRLIGFGDELANGTPTLKFEVIRPSGTTILRVKPNMNGTFSPVRF